MVLLEQALPGLPSQRSNMPQGITCFVVDVKVGEGLGHLLVGQDLHIKHALLLFLKI